jgi:hypothetical protein
MGYKPELTDASIYTLRRRIPARPPDEKEEPSHRGADVQGPGQLGHSVASATRLTSLIARLFPTVRLGH